MAESAEEKAPAKAAKEAEKAAAKAGTSAVSVYNASGQFVRTYTAELHGDSFIQLAEGFAKKIGGKVSK